MQELINAFGEIYIEAEAEADEVCARLVIKKIAYACLSEDMDLFVYGCPRVLRYFSLVNETFVIYYLHQILKELNIPLKEFKEICIISGTDYNLTTRNNNTNLYITLKYYYYFKNIPLKYNKLEFYTWLDKTSDYIDNIYNLYNIYNMFTTEDICLKKYNIHLNKKKINTAKIKELMIPEGFIFLDG